MSALTKFFFTPVYAPRSAWTVVNWWESRRAIYNLSVGAAGVLSLAAVAVADVLPPHARAAQIPWGGIVIYAVLANLFYSVGPVVDVAIHRRLGPTYAAVGPALFRYGFAFAVGLTLLPIPLSIIGWVIRALRILG